MLYVAIAFNAAALVGHLGFATLRLREGHPGFAIFHAAAAVFHLGMALGPVL